MTAQEHLSQYEGVTLQLAFDFITGHLNDLQTIYSTCKQFGVTTDMIAEILEFGGIDVSGEIVANYFADNGIDSDDLGGSVRTIYVQQAEVWTDVADETLLRALDVERDLYALTAEIGSDYRYDYSYEYDAVRNAVTVTDQNGWYEEHLFNDYNLVVQRNIYNNNGILLETKSTNYDQDGYLASIQFQDFEINDGKTSLGSVDHFYFGEVMVEDGVINARGEFDMTKNGFTIAGSFSAFNVNILGSSPQSERIEFDYFNDGQIDLIEYAVTDEAGNLIQLTQEYINPLLASDPDLLTETTTYEWMLIG